MCKINVYIAAFALAGCDAAPLATAADAGASPNASILPAPLATEPPDLFDGGAPTDDGARPPPTETPSRPAPESLRAGVPLAADATPFQKDGQKDGSGVTVDAAFRWRDVPAPPRAPEVSLDAHREALKQTALSLKIDLTELGRMRAELTGSAFLLPAHTELRARSDHYGNLVVWPNGGGYRVVAPGALRPLLGERRMDITPLSVGNPRPQGEARRLGFAVRKLEVSSSVATIRLELARVPESGEGGALLCRALVELGGVDPRSPICQAGEVPLAASYSWQEGGGISFEASAVTKRTDFPTSALLVPPAGVAHLTSGLAAVAHGIFLSRETLAALRTVPITLPASHDPQVPGEGFVAANHSERLMVFCVDGVPALWVPPFGEQYVIGPLRGRYGVQWRTFLGEKVGAPFVAENPARLVYGVPPDGGAPDGG
jgi:hypothetical protein